VAFLFIWVLARILACVHGHAKTPFNAPARSSSLATSPKHVIRSMHAAASIRCALRFTHSSYVPGHRAQARPRRYKKVQEGRSGWKRVQHGLHGYEGMHREGMHREGVHREGMHVRSGEREGAGTWSGSHRHVPSCTFMYLRSSYN